MSADIIAHPKLEEVLKPLIRSKREYLCLRIMGMGEPDAMRFALRKPSVAPVWRSTDPEFREIETYLTGNRELYKAEADVIFLQEMEPKLKAGFMRMVEKFEDWDNQNDRDKHHILRAIHLLGNVLPAARPIRGRIEEVIFRRREG